MAKWAFKVASILPSAAADGASITNDTYLGIKGNSATQRYDLSEIYMGGQATSSAPFYIVLARSALVGSSTTASTLAAGNQAVLDAQATTTLSSMVFTSTTTPSTRAQNGGLLALPFNGFGGIVRWVAPPGSEIKGYGQAVSTGEMTLSGYTGSAASADAKMGAHFIYEPY